MLDKQKNINDGQSKVLEYFNNPTNAKKEEVVLSYLPLVNHVINKIPIDNYQNILSKEDLFQNGVMGLLSALDKYDPEMNTTFKSFCYTRVHGSIIDTIRNNSTLSRDQVKKYKNIVKSRDKLSKKLYREPSVNEIGLELGISPNIVNKTISNYEQNSNISIDSPSIINEDNNLSYHETLASDTDSPEQELDKKEKKKLLKRSISNLPEKQRLVLALYYYEELKISEIGSILDVSDGRVSQILKSTLELLRTNLQSIANIKDSYSIV